MVVFYAVYNACLMAWSYWLYGKTMANSLQVGASDRHGKDPKSTLDKAVCVRYGLVWTRNVRAVER